MTKVEALFLFSLPRAGSTLLQRMLAAHPAVATTSEPWLLLPFFDAMIHEDSTFSIYGHALATQAVRDFSEELAGGWQSYEREVADLALRLYAKASSPESSYFLDKTPRYHIISHRILRLFPQAKAILLVRHPLAVVASMVETFADGKWYLYGSRVDLYAGLESLLACYEEFQERILLVRYEDIVYDPETQMRRVYAYLGLENSDSWQQFARVNIEGHMKDPTGMRRYQAVSTEPVDKWKQSFSNLYRVRWARRYLAWIGKKRLALLGYDVDAIFAELDELPTGLRGISSDVLRDTYGGIRTFIQGDVLAALRARSAMHRYILR